MSLEQKKKGKKSELVLTMRNQTAYKQYELILIMRNQTAYKQSGILTRQELLTL
jgi:hypothetical protein